MAVMIEFEGVRCTTDDILAELCKASFEDFVREFWSVVESAPFVDNWHISGICQHLQAVTDGQISNLLINVPPGCSKSLLTSVFWPMWEWTRDESVRWFYASYDQRLSTRDSVKCRALLSSSLYQRLFVRQLDGSSRFTIKDDQNQKTYYETNQGGYRLATSVGGHGTGEHPDRIVVDDPHNVKEAESEVERQSVIDWWDLTMSTRGVSRQVRRVIIMQRLHHKDLAGHVLEQGEFEHICLPMRYEKNRMGTTSLGWNDPRTEEDELLTPRQFSEEAVARLEKILGAYGTAGQLQQRPMPRFGGMFKVQYFSQRVKAAPYHANRVRSWDRASTMGAGCATAGVLLSATDDAFYVEDGVMGQWEPTERNEIMYATALKDRARYGPSNEPTIIVEEEGGSTAADARKVIAKKLAGFRVLFVHPTGSKDVRAEPWSAQLAAGNVFIVDNGQSQGQGASNWNIEEFVQQHLNFRPEPGRRVGGLIDYVDSASQGFTHLINSVREGTMRTYTFGLNGTKQIAQRIVVCSVDQLKEVVIQEHAIFIHSADPVCDNNSDGKEAMLNARGQTSVHMNGDAPHCPLERPPLPAHALIKLLGSAVLVHADIQPSECQDNWEELIQPWNQPVENLVLRPEEAKRLWSIVLRKYDSKWRILVLSDSGGNDRRALSLAYCVCDVLRLSRTQTIYRVGHEGWQSTTKDDVPNRHVYDTAKQARNMVAV